MTIYVTVLSETIQATGLRLVTAMDNELLYYVIDSRDTGSLFVDLFFFFSNF